ncbi:TIGR02680 family protein [Kitasatospora sp. NPDC058397]|uniref:TIGR02680 family protein n=1 Tax=unclassified Kitasatospora TaxID=2633591 RepID=UPI003666CD6E
MTEPTDGAPSAALQGILDGALPVPERNRFQQLRLGLIGIWEYEEQEFVSYGHGLILRGRNGAGKTKVMEVTSPLLLDAVLSARRLDPFGSTARPMRDNLLHRGRTQRVGYSWCEYGRVAEDGSHEYVTIGIGMRASTSVKGGLHKPWFFVTEKRVGQDFDLFNEHRQPHLRKQLEARLGPQSVFEDRREYRAAVAERLFGFSSGSLASLVELLLVLRKPKLSENFNGEKLSRMLSNGLPPVSTVLLDDLAVRFDQLARDRKDLAQQERHLLGMQAFQSVYTRYARRWTRNLADHVVKAEQSLDAATRGRDKASDELAEAEKALDQATGERRQLKERHEKLQTALGELRSNPLMEQHELLSRLQEQAEEAKAKLPELQERYKKAETAVTDAASAADGKRQRLIVAAAALGKAEELSAVRAAQTRIEDTHTQCVPVIRTTPQEAEDTLLGHVQARASVLERAVELATSVQKVQAAFDHANEAFQKSRTLCNASRKAMGDHETEVANQVALLREGLSDWGDRCREFLLTDDELTELNTAVPTFGLPGASTLSQELTRLAKRLYEQLAIAAAGLESDWRRVGNDQKALTRTRLRVAQETDPLPAPPPHRRRDRTAAADGAPLWRLLEFAPHLTDSERTGLESSLLGSGVLDAWVTSSGAVLDSSTLDTVLPADRAPVPGPSLTTVLQPVDNPMVPVEVTARVLAGLALARPGTPPPSGDWIATDGSWRIGPAHGRTAVSEPAYIGAAAREAERQRRLRVLDEQIAELDAMLLDLDERLETTRGRQNDLASEYEDAAGLDVPLRSRQQELATARKVFEAHDKQRELDEAAAAGRKRELEDAGAALDLYARERATATRLDLLASERHALQEYRTSLDELFRKVEAWAHREQQYEDADNLLSICQTHLAVVDKDQKTAIRDASQKREQYDVRRRVVGADVDSVLAELAIAQKALADTAKQQENNDRMVERATERAVRRKAAHEQSIALVEQRQELLNDRSGDYDRLQQLGFMELVSAMGSVPSPETSAAVRARAVLPELAKDPGDQGALDQARDDVDQARHQLERELAGQDWTVRSGNDERLVTVRLIHNGRSHTITQALAVVETEVRERSRLLDASEHDLFTEVLLGQVGDHLRRRRAGAKALVGEMNRLLGLRRTASGQVMRLVWEPDPEKGRETREALDTLDKQASRFLPDSAREHLITFLGQQIATAREAEGGTDWKAHLRAALDYRTWSRIRVQYKTGPQQKWIDIDAGMHGKGSGGEKAVMLQLPLFAAAAAHYTGAAPTAPRPVYLDEAFAGIDAEMRGECMGLLVELDLDFVMASHDEWGFYEEVPGVATYQLFRDPQTEGVLTTPIIWDGTRRHVMVDPALIGGAALDFGTDDDLGDDLDQDEDELYPDDEEDVFDAEGDDDLYSRTGDLISEADLD